MRVEVEVVLARQDQAPVLGQLIELYTYDFSFFRPFDVGADGRYGFAELPLYWTDAARIPYLVWADGKLAGFALVHKMTDGGWDMAQFFVLPRFRKRGTGQAVAEQLWQRHPGEWQVRSLELNGPACAFWHKAIARQVGKEVTPFKTETKGVVWMVYQFTANNQSLSVGSSK